MRGLRRSAGAVEVEGILEVIGPFEFGMRGGPFGPPRFGGRGPRVRRGDVRAAILDLLAEGEPWNGYQIIQQIADVEKFDLILQDPVVYASQRIDITERVIKALADK